MYSIIISILLKQVWVGLWVWVGGWVHVLLWCAMLFLYANTSHTTHPSITYTLPITHHTLPATHDTQVSIYNA